MFANFLKITFLFSVIIFSCNFSKNSEKKNPAQFQFESLSHDFGTIKRGEQVSHTFYFKNVGGEDLKIYSATGTCGCTIPKYDSQPIEAGKEGSIEVTFDSYGFTGNQHKTLIIKANTKPDSVVLSISAVVLLDVPLQKNY